MKTLLAPVLASLMTMACAKGSGNMEAKVKALTERVDELEARQHRLEEVETFVRPIMEQQKAQEQRQAASEPDPNVRFAVSVEGNDSDGPANAAVTIVEAFDFA